MRDTIFSFVLNFDDKTFSIFENGLLVEGSNDFGCTTFDHICGYFYPFMRTAGNGIQVKTISNMPLPISTPGK